MTMEALAELYQGQLDQAGLLAYADDLAALAGGVEVSVKRAERAYAEQERSLGLHAALEALANGAIRAVQLRYVHESVAWTDTLLRGAEGYRLVRMRGGAP